MTDAYSECSSDMQSIVGDPEAFNVYDIRIPCAIPPLCYDFSPVTNFLARSDVITALGVQNRPWQACNSQVYQSMVGDWEDSEHADVAYLLENGVHVLVYSGDKDFVCNWRGGEAWTYNLQWPYQSDF